MYMMYMIKQMKKTRGLQVNVHSGSKQFECYPLFVIAFLKYNINSV